MKKIQLIFLLLLGVSCLKEPKKITFEEIEAIGYEINEAVEDDDIKRMNRFFDVATLADRFLLKTNKKRVQQFNSGFFSGFSKQFNFGEIIIAEKSKGASYNFLRAYQDENKNFRLLFRLYGVDGLNYHSHLIKIINGKPKIIDTYIYVTGEYLSQTFSTIYKNLLYNNNFFKNNIDESKMVKDMEKLLKIRNLNSKGNYEEAYEIYQTISSRTKRTKMFKLQGIITAYNISEELYQEFIEDYEDSFPNDASLKLLSIDSYYLKKQYEKCQIVINELDSLIGGDSLLDMFRANVTFETKEYDKSMGYYKKIMEEYPDFIDPYYGMLNIYASKENHKQAIKIVDSLVNKFLLPKEEVARTIPLEYPKFAKTKEYLNWLRNNVQTTN